MYDSLAEVKAALKRAKQAVAEAIDRVPPGNRKIDEDLMALESAIGREIAKIP
jgi:hypothetical protein